MSVSNSFFSSSPVLLFLLIGIVFLFITNRNNKIINNSLAESLSKVEDRIATEQKAREVCLKQLDERNKDVVARDEQINFLTNQVVSSQIIKGLKL